jgi:hypothetical protein
MSRRTSLRAGQVLATVMAVQWMIFAVLTLTSQPISSAGLYAGGGFIAVMCALATAAWWRPVVGGVLLVAAATFSAWFFHNRGAFWPLSAPAAAAGILLLLSRGAPAPGPSSGVRA